MRFPLVLAVSLLALPALAHAQSDAGGDTSMTVDSEASGLDEEARIVYEAGVVAYGEQRFDNALEYFERAYELSERPTLLFNIGLAADRLREDARAVEAYQAYLDQAPDVPNRAEVEERLRLLRAELARDAEQTTSTTTTADDSGGSNVAPIILLSLGGLAVGGAVAGAVWWANRADALNQCDDRGGCMNASTIEGEQSAAIGVTIATGVVALAAITTGVILLAAGGGAGDDDASATTCGVSPLGVTCSGRF